MQARPEGGGNAKALDGTESAQEAVDHAPEVGEVIDEEGEANQAVHNYVKEEPVQHLEVAEAHPLVQDVDVLAEEQLPVDADVGDACRRCTRR